MRRPRGFQGGIQVDTGQGTRQAALLDVFRNGRRRAGDSISELELVAAWTRTGRRCGDLQAALGDLTHSGLLAVRIDGGGPRVVLTRAGCHAIQAQRGEWPRRLGDWWRRQWLRLRAVTSPLPVPRRSEWLMAAIAAVLTLAPPAAPAQVLASYTICALAEPAPCEDEPERAMPDSAVPALARGSPELFLQWAMTAHRAAVKDARFVRRTAGPVAVSRDGAQADARPTRCRMPAP